ncbi:ricin-type beta-trefoil lectin domain protein [Amycolatopsis sp. CA-230715]|uniref:ricin-type beta-trefoil lectin domain protein n=1 Tax=Amycolatopsis sp. CA-230715 TaxID=2745196 RepID=UPI001C0246AA|nr:ricin-type beta-trefoil lectin domain protein [Amycolatopsis sp. CA-230715]QWF82000.1 hypothetical protein HUW46_05436 [Amycolatopsis sp. CA-230715]
MRVKGILAGALASVSALAVVSAGTAEAMPGRQLKNAATHQCATVDYTDYVSGVYLRPCDIGSEKQRWLLEPIGDGLYHVTTTGNFCLSMASASPYAGYPTMTQPCGLNLTEERWRVSELEPGIRALYSPQDNRYADGPYGSDRVVMGVDVGKPVTSQTWIF